MSDLDHVKDLIRSYTLLDWLSVAAGVIGGFAFVYGLMVLAVLG